MAREVLGEQDTALLHACAIELQLERTRPGLFMCIVVCTLFSQSLYTPPLRRLISRPMQLQCMNMCACVRESENTAAASILMRSLVAFEDMPRVSLLLAIAIA
jgi:hypothetical protein